MRFVVQISKNRKAYQNITKDTSLENAFDAYRAAVNFGQPKGVKVRMVCTSGAKLRVVRSGVAEGSVVRWSWEPPFASTRPDSLGATVKGRAGSVLAR